MPGLCEQHRTPNTASTDLNGAYGAKHHWHHIQVNPQPGVMEPFDLYELLTKSRSVELSPVMGEYQS